MVAGDLLVAAEVDRVAVLPEHAARDVGDDVAEQLLALAKSLFALRAGASRRAPSASRIRRPPASIIGEPDFDRELGTVLPLGTSSRAVNVSPGLEIDESRPGVEVEHAASPVNSSRVYPRQRHARRLASTIRPSGSRTKIASAACSNRPRNRASLSRTASFGPRRRVVSRRTATECVNRPASSATGHDLPLGPHPLPSFRRPGTSTRASSVPRSARRICLQRLPARRRRPGRSDSGRLPRRWSTRSSARTPGWRTRSAIADSSPSPDFRDHHSVPGRRDRSRQEPEPLEFFDASGLA